MQAALATLYIRSVEDRAAACQLIWQMRGNSRQHSAGGCRRSDESRPVRGPTARFLRIGRAPGIASRDRDRVSLTQAGALACDGWRRAAWTVRFPGRGSSAWARTAHDLARGGHPPLATIGPRLLRTGRFHRARLGLDRTHGGPVSLGGRGDIRLRRRSDLGPHIGVCAGECRDGGGGKRQGREACYEPRTRHLTTHPTASVRWNAAGGSGCLVAARLAKVHRANRTLSAAKNACQGGRISAISCFFVRSGSAKAADLDFTLTPLFSKPALSGGEDSCRRRVWTSACNLP